MEGDFPVGVARDRPAAFVQKVVVAGSPPAHRQAVRLVGRAAVFPMLDCVVDFALVGSGVASGEPAATVAEHDRPVLIGCERPCGPTHIERDTLAADDDALHDRVAREPPDRVGG
jgi:hypothetical protein